VRIFFGGRTWGRGEEGGEGVLRIGVRVLRGGLSKKGGGGGREQSWGGAFLLSSINSFSPRKVFLGDDGRIG